MKIVWFKDQTAKWIFSDEVIQLRNVDLIETEKQSIVQSYSKHKNVKKCFKK